MARLQLRFLGNPEVWYRGEMLAFPTRKSFALLVYLAVEGYLHTREELAALFWPESDSERSQASLRNALARLRATLRKAALPLIVTRDALGFDASDEVELDLHLVERAMQSIESGAVKPSRLQAATAAWRGEFLAGFTLPNAPDFDDWVSVQREQWHQRLAVVFNHLSQFHMERGAIPQALESTAQWLAHDPWSELAYRRLMALHLTGGDRGSALRVWQGCQHMLSELGVEPALETVELAERIRSTVLPAPKPKPVEVPALPLEIPLVGRGTEHQQLVSLFHTVSTGRAQVVAVEGEAGIGKTRLVSTFLRWATVEGADVLKGRAFEMGSPLPYQPLIDALRERVDRENAPEDLLDDTWLAELSRLLPELRHRYPDLPAPARDDAVARARLFEAVARLLQALSNHRPVVLWIDDVQWVDSAARDLLHYLGKRWLEMNAPILLLLSVRSEDLATMPALAEWLSRLDHTLHLTTIRLKALTVDDTRQLIKYLARAKAGDAGAEEAFGQWLYRETQGHPFYMVEAIRALLERGLLQWRRGEEQSLDLEGSLERLHALAALPLSPRVREVILGRTARLSEDATALITATAVIGRDCGFEQMRQVAGVETAAGLRALDELLANRMLRESDALLRPYSFSHDTIRDIVYTEAGAARRQVFHRRAFHALETTAPAAELAYHARAAGLLKQAFRYGVAAGDEAMHLLAVQDAIRHYEQARQVERDFLCLAPDDGMLTDLHIRLYAGLGRAFELAGDYAQVEATFHELLELARGADQPHMIVTALIHLALAILHDRNDAQTALELLQEARLVAEAREETALLAEVEWALAQLASVATADPTEMVTHSQSALALARELDQRELIARSLNKLGHGKRRVGEWEAAEKFLEEAAALYVELGDRVMEADSLSLLCSVQLSQGKRGVGLANGQTAYQKSLEIKNLWGQVHSIISMVPGLLDAGDYMTAIQMAQQAAALARSLDVPFLLYVALLREGAVYQAIQAPVEALHVHLQTEEFPPNNFRDIQAAALCVDYAMLDDWEQAYHYARRALDARENYRILPIVPPLRWLETEALLRCGDEEAAREDVRRFGRQIGDNMRYRIPYLRSLATLAEWEKDFLQAITCLEEAHALAVDIALPAERWQILAELGTLHQAVGDGDRSQAAWQEAAEQIQLLMAKLPEGEWREKFLAAGPVQRVLSKSLSV